MTATKNSTVYVTVGMYCGSDGSDLLSPNVFTTRDDARREIISMILEAAEGAELVEEGKLLDQAKIMVYAPSLGEPDDSIRDLVHDDTRIPPDVSRIIVKDNSYDEYWEWKVEERRVF